MYSCRRVFFTQYLVRIFVIQPVGHEKDQGSLGSDTLTSIVYQEPVQISAARYIRKLKRNKRKARGKAMASSPTLLLDAGRFACFVLRHQFWSRNL